MRKRSYLEAFFVLGVLLISTASALGGWLASASAPSASLPQMQLSNLSLNQISKPHFLHEQQAGWSLSTDQPVYNYGDTVTFLVTKPGNPPGHNCIVDVTFYIVATLPDRSQNSLGPLSFPDSPGTYAVSAGQAGPPPGSRLAELWGQAGVGCVNPPPSPVLYATTTYAVQGAPPTPTCPDGQSWNGAQCVCPSGQQWNGQQCVNPPPSPLQVSISANPTSGIVPLAVSFSATVSGGIPPYSYQWYFGDGSTSASSNPTHVYSQQGSFQAYLRVSDSSGNSASSNSVTVSVSQKQQFCLDIKSETAVSGSPRSVQAVVVGAPAHSCSYGLGDRFTIQAPTSSSDGYFFLAWIEDGVVAGMDTPLQVTMNSNHNVIAAYVDHNILQNFVDQFGSKVGSQDYISSVASKIANDAWNDLKQTTVDSPGFAGSLQPFTDILIALASKGSAQAVPAVGFVVDLATMGTDIGQCNQNPPSSSCNMQKVTNDLHGITGNAVIGIASTGLCYSIAVALALPTAGIGTVALGIACAVGPVILGQLHAPGQQLNFGQWIGAQVNGFFARLSSDFCSFIQKYFPNKWFCVKGGSSVVLMVQDSGGRRAGGILQSGSLTAYNEIPGALYSGIDSHPQEIAVLQPVQGQYAVLVTGVGGGGSYSLSASLTDNSGSTISTVSDSGTVSGGQTQSLSANLGSNAVTISQKNGGILGTDAMTTLATAVVTALIVLIGSEVLLRRRRRR